MPARLRPTAPIAADAILVGDPGRALLLAQELLEQPKMSNHARGLWGYSGLTPAGRELTIQSTGMGGPSAAIVLQDLAELGVRRAVRVGTCTALWEFEPGELVVVTETFPEPGGFFLTPVAEEDQSAVAPDSRLTLQLVHALAEEARGVVSVSLDVLHRPAQTVHPAAEVADMQTATLFAIAAEFEISAAALLIVTQTRDGRSPDDEQIASAAKRAGKAAAHVLSV
jgi:purine-nucleoside phosphorylase